MSLPVIRGSSAALYPFTMTISFDTLVGQFQGGTQQRSARRKGLVRCEIPYAALIQSQKNTVKAAVTSAKGQFDGTLSISLPFAGSLASFFNFSLDSDDFAATENITKQYSAPLKLSQTLGQSLSPGTAGTAFPRLANGTIGILPYTQHKRFQTVATKMTAGPKYTFAEFGGGVTGYATDGLMAWDFAMTKVSDADIATLTGHFIANAGRLSSFSFTDEDATAYTTAHYSMDDMTVTYSGPNDSAVKITIEATA